MFNDLSIRNKLILLLAGPLLIILLLSFIGAKDRRAAASESAKVERLANVSRANTDVVDALQQESLYSSAYVGSDRATWEEELKAARGNTDTVLAQALPLLQNDLGGTSSEVTSAAQLALGAADKLTFVRESIDQGLRPDQVHQVVVNYRDTEATFIAVNTAVAGAMPDPQAAADLRTAVALAEYKSSLGVEASSLVGAAEQGRFPSDKAYAVYAEARDAEAGQLVLFNSLATRELKADVRNALATDNARVFDTVREEADEAGAKGALDIEGAGVVTSGGGVLKDLHEIESASSAALVGAAQSAASSAQRASSLFLIAAVVAIVGAAFAALVIGRMITKPLRRLTEAADRLSTEQMPRLIETLKNPSDEALDQSIGAMRPIDIESDDEIGQLARSFNEVQRVAGAVAAEQAQLLRKGIGEMFVNLARRNQALLDRQIEFIDELERGEEDPDQLDNLYRLDHLATRMRRNAESLLVLAGAEPPRRRGRPAPLANVVRAALAEVEDFGRIELLSFDEVLVASNAAADLAHLLSELMENATNFSPPETRVEVVGHKTKADGYVISVTDHGIGMSPDQVADANESLARPPLVGLAMSRSLGFIVVGRLAARHGIAVRMMPSAAGGVTAVVSIPPSLVVDTPGGMAETESMAVPARLKPVFEGTGGGGLEGVSLGDDAGPAEPPAFDASPLLEPLGGSSVPEPAVFAPPSEPQAPASAEPVAWPPLGAEPEPPAPEPTPMPSREPVAPRAEIDPVLAAQVDDAVQPAMPAALSFSAPDATDVVPPTAPPPSVQAAGAGADAVPPRNGSTPRPFFLEDAAPPRPFGQGAPDASARSATPEPAAPPAPKLFGGPQPAKPAAPAAPGGLPGRTPRTAPAPADAPRGDAPAPLVSRVPSPAPDEAAATPEVVAPEVVAPQPAPTPPPAPEGVHLDTAPPRAPKLDARPPAAPLAARHTPPMPPGATVSAPPAPPAPPAAPSAPAADAAASTTTSGLAKRVPRAAGASRAIPGSEVERGVAGSRRSPEEIRKMLAQHSAGRQRARTQEPVPAGAPEEREAHE